MTKHIDEGDSGTMTINTVAPGETGLISRCKRINEKLAAALALTIEITGQHYDESKTDELNAADLTSDLLSWIRVIALKVDNLVTQLECIKEQF